MFVVIPITLFLAWAVTRTAELVRYSYPELQEVARYRLGTPAGPVAFDPDANRLFLATRTSGHIDPMRPESFAGEPGPRDANSDLIDHSQLAYYLV